MRLVNQETMEQVVICDGCGKWVNNIMDEHVGQNYDLCNSCFSRLEEKEGRDWTIFADGEIVSNGGKVK